MPKLLSKSHEDPASPHYVGWRGELLAQLALSRLDGVTAYRQTADNGYDYLVATADGLCFFVQVKAFSSVRRGMVDLPEAPDLTWQVDARLIEHAARSRSPVVLFLFDADTEHGRFLRLDRLRPVPDGRRSVALHLPVENTISKESLGRLISELETDVLARRD